jgi:pyruvate dehydrogenase E2 component (dihydrolipoamide acetyltransferase)
MATYEYTLPELGEGIEEGDVIQVLIATGDSIAKDQSVIELETDKAVIEVPAPVDGVVKQIHVQPGDKAAVGQLILTLETETATEAPTPTPEVPAPDTAPEPPAASPPADMPREPIAPAVADQTDGAEREVGVPRERPEAPAQLQHAAPAAPTVRRLAREIGVDINQVSGTGPGGRISHEDVKEYAKSLLSAQEDITEPAAPPAAPAGQARPDFTRWGGIDRQPMGNVRRKTAEQMALAWATIPHVTQFDKADITDLDHLRRQFAPRAEAAGGKLTVTAVVLKVVAAALRRFPQFNASLDLDSQEIVYKHYYHLGVAVDTDRGLLVPVIRDVDRKSVVELSVELARVSERARNRKVSLEEMQGATFTVTNLGGLGGTHFTPIINPPEVAILGLARSAREPVYIDGQFEPRLMLPLALSYDHRLIDGADGVRFLRWIAETLQQPFLIALEG